MSKASDKAKAAVETAAKHVNVVTANKKVEQILAEELPPKPAAGEPK